MQINVMMIKSIFLSVFLTFFVFNSAYSQIDKPVKISDELEIMQISEHVYLHISNGIIPGYGRVSSNGAVVISKGEAVLLDTPVNDTITELLVKYLQNSLKVKIKYFVPNHWHSDCVGGLAYLQKTRIQSIANKMTVDIAKSKGHPVPDKHFDKNYTLKCGGLKLLCFYPGAAHTTDNIVVWIPEDKVLFAGCMAKAVDWETLGNTADGSLPDYARTIKTVMQKFPEAQIVIPGHGKPGGMEVLEHTYKLAQGN
jgi:metallo-beta-lactamase class B